jgi:FtsH-binding integral membrane protein
MSLSSTWMTREFLASSSLLTATSFSNFQTNELVEQPDDKGVSRFFVVVAPFAACMLWEKKINAEGKPVVQCPDQ